MGGSFTHWPSAFDLNNLTAGSGKLLGLHSQTVQAICEEYATRRKQFNKPFLQFRTNKKNRNLSWIPFKAKAITFDSQSGTVTFMGLKLKTWYSRALPEGAKIKTGSIVRDSTGKWFINLTFKLTLTEEESLSQISAGQNLTAIDPGLNPMLTLSIEAPDGSVTYEEIEPPKYYRKSQDKLAVAQRANKKKQVQAIHKQIKHQRKDFLNKLALRLVKENHTIVDTDLTLPKLIQSKLKGHSKSWSDLGLGYLRQTLKFKAYQHSVKYEIVSEKELKSTLFKHRVCDAQISQKPVRLASL